MGMDQKVVFPKERAPAWPALVECLAAKKLVVELRMIDGELAFPEESPPENWRELRIGAAGGMITLRRELDGITLVIWGNADEKLRAACTHVATAIADLAAGNKIPTGP